MKKIMNFNNYMKEKLNEFKSNSLMICPECDGSGYLRDKDDKSKKCPMCKGVGQLKFKKEKKEKNE